MNYQNIENSRKKANNKLIIDGLKSFCFRLSETIKVDPPPIALSLVKVQSEEVGNG